MAEDGARRTCREGDELWQEGYPGYPAILPIWHEIDQEGVTKYSPLLARRLAGRSADGMTRRLQQILAALRA